MAKRKSFSQKMREKRRLKNKPSFDNIPRDFIFSSNLTHQLDEDEIEIFSTPFGDIPIIEDDVMFLAKSQRFVVDFAQKNQDLEEVVEDELLNVKEKLHLRLLAYKDLKKLYPNEPIINHEITEVLEKLRHTEKQKALIKENYERFDGFPIIDITYAAHFYEGTLQECLDEIFGGSNNIAENYPERPYFDGREVRRFYVFLAVEYLHEDNIEMAEKCLEVLDATEAKAASIIRTRIKMKKDPWVRRKAIAMLIGLVLLVLAIIVGVIWGIIKFFQWIF